MRWWGNRGSRRGRGNGFHDGANLKLLHTTTFQDFNRLSFRQLLELVHAQNAFCRQFLGEIKARGGNANAKSFQRLRQRLHVGIFGLSWRRRAAQSYGGSWQSACGASGNYSGDLGVEI